MVSTKAMFGLLPARTVAAPHRNASVKFFKLVQIGTPVTIAESLRRMTRLPQRRAPDRLPRSRSANLRHDQPDYFSQPRDSQLLPAKS